MKKAKYVPSNVVQINKYIYIYIYIHAHTVKLIPFFINISTNYNWIPFCFYLINIYIKKIIKLQYVINKMVYSLQI
ncbi:hypothetical protein [Plasmodium yoelii yoelii]|uniref:Uncharacterized protein n=1 Tax=Plasmodium yoelii yoelii TaxID=73239 RepID=Q7RA11_PLAYO|nr:hypothetical protein [Plasmodium yoelii yoelii]